MRTLADEWRVVEDGGSDKEIPMTSARANILNK